MDERAISIMINDAIKRENLRDEWNNKRSEGRQKILENEKKAERTSRYVEHDRKVKEFEELAGVIRESNEKLMIMVTRETIMRYVSMYFIIQDFVAYLSQSQLAGLSIVSSCIHLIDPKHLSKFKEIVSKAAENNHRVYTLNREQLKEANSMNELITRKEQSRPIVSK